MKVIKNVGESDYEECLRFKEENDKNLDLKDEAVLEPIGEEIVLDKDN